MKRLYRDTDNRVVGGVCSGIAEILDVDVSLVRIIAALAIGASGGTGFVVYIISWMIIPPKYL